MNASFTTHSYSLHDPISPIIPTVPLTMFPVPVIMVTTKNVTPSLLSVQRQFQVRKFVIA